MLPSRGWAIACAAACCIASTAGATDGKDPSDAHRWHLPQRGDQRLEQKEVGPAQAEWNLLGRGVDAGKQQLARAGIRFDADLAVFDQYANRVISGKQNFGDFSWRVMGDWKLLDLGDDRCASWIGRGFVGWTGFGSIGFGYDVADQSPSGNVGALDQLNAATFQVSGVLDEFYWKQVTLGGRLVLVGGKVDLMFHFDSNAVANDAFSQLVSYTFQNNPSIPGPLYGGFGAIARLNLPKKAYVMLGFADSSVTTATPVWQTGIDGSFYELLELGVAVDVPGLGDGHYRLTPWHNSLDGQSGFGIALNVDQALGRSNLIAFFRFGYGDPDVTPVQGFVSGGVVYRGPFGREGDRAALGLAWSKPGVGAGDRAEGLLELAYTIEVFEALTLTPDLQLVFHPSDNPDADLAVVPGVRLLMEF